VDDDWSFMLFKLFCGYLDSIDIIKLSWIVPTIMPRDPGRFTRSTVSHRTLPWSNHNILNRPGRIKIYKIYGKYIINQPITENPQSQTQQNTELFHLCQDPLTTDKQNYYKDYTPKYTTA